jgi:hypothetical protein
MTEVEIEMASRRFAEALMRDQLETATAALIRAYEYDIEDRKRPFYRLRRFLRGNFPLLFTPWRWAA